MLKAENIQLMLNKRSILWGIDLTLKPGEVTAILGPNGAGKTSLLRVLSGEWEPTRGNVELNGTPLGDIPVKRLGQLRAYLHQESSLDFAFTALEVVLLGRSPHMRGGERPEDYTIARKALKEVDLSDREEDHYTSLSGGEKQRVHLARVLAQMEAPSLKEDRYLFLDEPTNNLDLSHQQTIFSVARRIAKSDTAVCMVLHDLNQAIRHADRICILDKGGIALEGDPEAIVMSDECERIFGVPIRRVEVPEAKLPYLVFGES